MSDLITMPRAVAEQVLEALVMTQREAQIGEADYAIAALRAALAQQAEPVAWIESPHGAIRANPLYRMTAPQSLAWSIPLYAAPPRREWVPLTDEQLRKMHHEDQFGLFCDYDEFEQIARATELTCKEKNHG